MISQLKKVTKQVFSCLNILLAVVFVFPTSNVFASDDDELESAERKPVRKFNDVLGDLLNEFAFDLKTNQVRGLTNVSLRRVVVTDPVPKTYEQYLQSLIAERFQVFSKIKVIQCTSCRVKRSMVKDNRLVITTPINDPAELDIIAQTLGVDVWLDVSLLYQETNMILAFNAFDSKTKELIWSRVYNSEDLYRKDKKLTVESFEQAKKREEMTSRSVFTFTTGWIMIPNVTGTSNMMGLNFRGAESFNDTRSEVGALLSIILDPGLFIQDYSGVTGDAQAAGATKDTSTTKIKAFQYGGALYATYYHNFISLPENFDVIRYGAHGGLGTIFSPGYLTFSLRTGPYMKFGKRWLLESALTYSMPTTISFGSDLVYKTKGGVGAELTFGLLF